LLQGLPVKELFCYRFEQNCSAMATQKLQEKVVRHDEDALIDVAFITS